MSVYAFLVSPETRELIFLGKALWWRNEDPRDNKWFHRGDADGPRNHDQPLLTRAVWKFLATHTGREIRVLLEHDMPDDECDYLKIGQGDEENGISFEDYLKDWPALTG